MSGTPWDGTGQVPPDGGHREVIAGGAPAGGGYVPAPDGYALGGQNLLPPPPRRRRGALVAGVVAGVVGVGAAGVVGLVAANGLFGGGDQPEQHLPSTVVAMAKIDLDPSAGQKVDAIRFARKFPQGKDLREDGDPRQWLWQKLTEDVEGAPSWDRASAWVGDRAAVALMPDPSDPAAPKVVGVLAVSDDERAVADMRSVRNAGVAAADGWLVVADSVTTAQAALQGAKSSPLAGSTAFAEDLDRLGEDGIAAAWYDGTGLSKMLSSLASSRDLAGVTGCAGAGQSSRFDRLSGHGAVALRFSGADLELFGTTVGITGSSVSGAGTGVEQLPAGTLGAVGFAGLGKAVGTQWDAMLQQIGDATCEDPQTLLAPAEAAIGLSLPDDLVTLLGDRTAVAVGAPDALGLPSVGLKVASTGADLRGVLDKVRSTVDDAGLPVTITPIDGGYVAGTSEDETAALQQPGTLGASPAFGAAVPDAAKAAFVGYADVAGLVAAYGDTMPAGARQSFSALTSLGISVVVTPDGTSTLRMKLTTR